MSFLRESEVILFQGDSVTDCGRNYNDINSLGYGYPLIISSILASICIENDFVFINKGISGDRTCDLVSRWDKDCINLNPSPTIVSILIGINDTWRRFDSDNPTTTEAYESNYCNILTRTRDELNAKIIILEPFVLPVGDDKQAWREDLDPKIQSARKLAREFGALYVPLDGLFAAKGMKKSPSFWAGDGVHPSNAGHALIADAWIDAVK